MQGGNDVDYPSIENDFAICDFLAFKDSLVGAGEILYIGDNADDIRDRKESTILKYGDMFHEDS